MRNDGRVLEICVGLMQDRQSEWEAFAELLAVTADATENNQERHAIRQVAQAAKMMGMLLKEKERRINHAISELRR